MKNNTLNISIIAALCVFCTAASDSFAAGSVRVLGGAGTYNGTTAATASTAARGAAGARAGSLRVSPSTTRTVSTATRTNADGTTTPTERLSIGKYLGGATSVSTTGGTFGAGATTSVINDIKNDIQTLFSNVQTIDGDITTIENELAGKQDALTAGDYITIENDIVSLDYASLETYLASALGATGGVNVKYNDTTDYIQWTADDGTTWTNLFKVGDLTGDYISESELESKIDALNKYATISMVNALDTRVTNVEGDITTITGDISTLETQINNVAGTQSDWAQADDTKMDFIKNKPNVAAIDARVTNIEGDITSIEGDITSIDARVTNVEGDINTIQTNITSLQNVAGTQSDWNQTDTTAPNYIKNKPDMANYATTTALQQGLDTKANANIVGDGFDPANTIAAAIAAKADANSVPTTQDLSDATARIGALETKVGDDTAGLIADVNAIEDDMNSLTRVAFTADYDDLINTPTIPAAQVNADWNATSGVAQILNKPTIPAAQIQSDWNQTDTAALDYIKNKPNIPDGVSVDTALSTTSENPVQNKVVTAELGTKLTSADLGVLNTAKSAIDAADDKVYVLGVVAGEPQLLNVVPDSNGNYK